MAIKTRSGSVAVMIGGIVLALLIFFGAFIKYSTSRQYATKRLNRVLLAREFSAALATLACHHLKEIEIRNRSGKLARSLEKPLVAMSASIKDKIVFTPFIQKLIARLEAANSELYELTWSVGWEVRKGDFIPVTAAYPREKTGMVRIPIVVEYRAPASYEKITEEYIYIVNIKVLANLIPVLSRFTLYVKNARSGEDEERFNKVVSNDNGNLVEKIYRPWVLKNAENNDNFPRQFKDVIKSSRGLVYLGGGRINLGISRGWIPAGSSAFGTFSEGFHLLGEGRRDGFYKIGEIGPMVLLNCETGLSKTDLNNPDSVSWYDLIKSGYAEMSAKTSIFKLYGTDDERSPTLVFGNAAARTICGRAYRQSSENYGPLPYTYDDNQFEDYRTAGGEDYDFSYFMDKYSDHNGGAVLSRSQYNREYASCLIEVPYNRALGYIIDNYKNDHPLDVGVIPVADPLFAFVSGQAVDKGIAEKIPAPLSDIYSDVQDLSSMKALLEALLNKLKLPVRPDIPDQSDITLARGEKLLSALKRRRYLDGGELALNRGKLNLNRWLRIKAPDGIVVDEPLRLISHGGIILDEGNIEIKNSIRAEGGKFLLNLVARRGNIIVDRGLNGALDVGLTAAGDGSDVGQVKFAGDGGISPVTVKGNVVMQRMAEGSLAGSCSRGVNIIYAEDLSALPKEASETRSEQPLLMFGFEYPRLLD